MELNVQKTKAMIFNFTKKQFSTRLTVKNENIEFLKETKLLGIIVTNNLKWSNNTRYLCKKAYARMQLLAKAANFTNQRKDLLDIYKTYVRNVVEQSSVVWSSSLTINNTKEFERIQKVAVQNMLKRNYSYRQSLQILNLPTLKERKHILLERFAINCAHNKKTSGMFQMKDKTHTME